MIQIDDIEMYDVQEVAEKLNISEHAARRLFSSKQLKGKKITRRWHVSNDELKRYLRETTEPDTA